MGGYNKKGVKWMGIRKSGKLATSRDKEGVNRRLT